MFHFRYWYYGLNLTKKIALWTLISLVLLYIAAFAYLKIAARDLVRHAIQNIETFYPQVQDISYKSTSFSPYDFLTENLTVNDITISFNDSDVVLHLDQIKVHNFMGLAKDPYGSFDLSFQNLTANSFQDLFTTLATWSNNNLLYSELGNVPDTLNLSVNGDINYDANSQTLSLNLNQLENNTQLLNYQTTLSPLPLSHEFFSDQNTFLNVLNQTAIVSSHYQLNFDQTFPIQDVESAFPLLGNFLQNIGYTNFPVHIDAQSDYQGGQNQQVFHANVNIAELGSIHLDWTLLYDQPLSPYNFANYLLNTNNPNVTENPPLIQSANITYTDESFMNRLYNYLSASMHQPISSIQSMIQGILTSYAAETNIPEFTSISNELSSFISNPGTLSFSLNPAQPFSFNDAASFFAKQQRLNTLLSNEMSTLSPTQKAILFNKYEQATSTAYSNFFNRIGLSVVANANVPTNS